MDMRTGLFAGALAALLLVVGCADDAEKAQEPAAAYGKTPAVPHAPGADAGTTADRAAGAGTAGEQAAEKQAEGAAGGVAMVTTSAVNVRKGAGMKSAVVRVLKQGEAVQAQGGEKKWCKIGEGEYVSEKYLKAAQ